jgi:hypothetical protein
VQENEVCDICYGEYRGRTVKGFIKYFLAKINEKRRNDSFRYYVTDCLQAIAQVEERWRDMLNPVDEGDEYEKALNNFYSDFNRKEE